MEVAERTAPHHALAYRLILWRALRLGEVVALEWSDLVEERGVLVVDQTAHDHGQGSGPTKTRKPRDVPLSADLLARLKAHRRDYPSTNTHVFTVEGRRVSLQMLRLLWDRIVAVARLPRITPKDGRATCATNLLDQGHPLPQVSQLLGHSSIATTAKFYARQLRRRAEQVAQLGEAFDASLGGVGKSRENAEENG